jgi:hypothetical protein
MRDLPKYCATKEGKRHVLKIAEEVEPVLPRNDCLDENGNPLPLETIDAKWAAANQQAIIYNIKKARNYHETKKEMETPIELLEAAYKKLTHENMDLLSIAVADLGKARKLAMDIKIQANDIESEIYRLQKDYKKVARNKT